MESKEERLLKAIFSTEDEMEEGDEAELENENYPETIVEKVGYAEYVITHSLEYIGRSIHRLSRLHNLLMLTEPDGDRKLPDIITHNELRMALEPLLQVENDIKDITEMLIEVYKNTKPQEPPKEEGT